MSAAIAPRVSPRCNNMPDATSARPHAIRKAKRSALLWKFIADGYRSGNAARRHGLVGRRALQAIDDEHLHGSGRGLELQPELLLQRGKEIRQVRVGSASGRRGRRILHVQIPSA